MTARKSGASSPTDLPRVENLPPDPGVTTDIPAQPSTVETPIIETTVVGMHNLLSQFPGDTLVQIVGKLVIDGEEYSVV